MEVFVFLFVSIIQPTPEIAFEEVTVQFKQMASGRCQDKGGMVIEVLNFAGPVLIKCICSLFNEVLKPNAPVRQEWREACLSLIFKSGTPSLPENYRPIAIIPILYKLFSQVLRSRRDRTFTQTQSKDQSGFR